MMFARRSLFFCHLPRCALALVASSGLGCAPSQPADQIEEPPREQMPAMFGEVLAEPGQLSPEEAERRLHRLAFDWPPPPEPPAGEPRVDEARLFMDTTLEEWRKAASDEMLLLLGNSTLATNDYPQKVLNALWMARTARTIVLGYERAAMMAFPGESSPDAEPTPLEGEWAELAGEIISRNMVVTTIFHTQSSSCAASPDTPQEISRECAQIAQEALAQLARFRPRILGRPRQTIAHDFVRKETKLLSGCKFSGTISAQGSHFFHPKTRRGIGKILEVHAERVEPPPTYGEGAPTLLSWPLSGEVRVLGAFTPAETIVLHEEVIKAHPGDPVSLEPILKTN